MDHPRCCYDPHYAPAWPAWRFDTILCHSMLNVLLPEEQVQVLMAVGEQDLLSESATVYALLDGAAGAALHARRCAC